MQREAVVKRSLSGDNAVYPPPELNPALRTPYDDSLEVARCANVRFGQPLLLPLVLLLPLGEGGVHNVVHLRVVMVTLNTADLWVFDVDGSHRQRRALKMTETVMLQLI